MGYAEGWNGGGEFGVNCDYIVKCYGTTNIDGKEYIIMKDLTKDNFISIKNLLKDTDLFKQHTNELKTTTEKLKKIKKELFETKTMVHGDLHTGNIMVSLDNGDVKLIDFGSSSVIKDENMLTYDQKMYLESDLTRLGGLIKCMNKIILTHDLQK